MCVRGCVTLSKCCTRLHYVIHYLVVGGHIYIVRTKQCVKYFDYFAILCLLHLSPLSLFLACRHLFLLGMYVWMCHIVLL